METIILYRGYIGIMEKKMETAILYRGYMGIMEKKMESTTLYKGDTGPRVVAACHSDPSSRKS